jgi:hypothetical protein
LRRMQVEDALLKSSRLCMCNGISRSNSSGRLKSVVGAMMSGSKWLSLIIYQTISSGGLYNGPASRSTLLEGGVDGKRAEKILKMGFRPGV